MNKKILVPILGESGSGKSSLLSLLSKWDSIPSLKEKINIVITRTDRPRRDYELDGVDYIFSNYEPTSENIVEHSRFKNDWNYWTENSDYKEDKLNIGIFNPNSYKKIKNNQNFILYPIIIIAEDKTRLIRSLNREAYPDCAEICRRFLSDKEDFKKIQNEISRRYIVISYSDSPLYSIEINYLVKYLQSIIEKNNI